MYETVKMKNDENFAKCIKEQRKRFLYDCFIFWKISMANFAYFESVLNYLHADIQFKVHKSTEKLPFLDIIVIKHGTSIVTDINFKSTGSKQYLHFISCHLKTTKIIIPFSPTRRTCTIVSDTNILKIRLQELATTLRSRQYPNEFI